MFVVGKIIFLLFLAGCSVNSKFQSIPSVEQIVTSNVVFELNRHYTAVKVLASLLRQSMLDAITLEQIGKFDNVRYFYIAKAEILVAEGRFEEAEEYVKQANVVIYQILRLLQNEKKPSIYENSEKEKTETYFQKPKTLL